MQYFIRIDLPFVFLERISTVMRIAVIHSIDFFNCWSERNCVYSRCFLYFLKDFWIFHLLRTSFRIYESLFLGNLNQIQSERAVVIVSAIHVTNTGSMLLNFVLFVFCCTIYQIRAFLLYNVIIIFIMLKYVANRFSIQGAPTKTFPLPVTQKRTWY